MTAIPKANLQNLPGAHISPLVLIGKVDLMADPTDLNNFEEIVEWAYGTLPQKIRELPDSPGHSSG
jgi:hypothetical protein